MTTLDYMLVLLGYEVLKFVLGFALVGVILYLFMKEGKKNG